MSDMSEVLPFSSADIDRKLERQRIADKLFRGLTAFMAIAVLALLGGVILSIIGGAWPALKHFGPAFLVTEVWNPVTEKFGALAPIFGTLVTSAIAMVVGVPLSFGIAIFLTEKCPMALR